MQALAVTATSFTPSTTQQYSGTTRINYIIDISSYSTLSRLLAVTAYVCRFMTNCKTQQQERETGPLTPSEQHHALITWVKQCQEEVYSREITSLNTNSTKRLPLVRQLRLFADADHLLRCGGRIHNVPLSEMAKFPLLLPPKHWLTSLIIQCTCTVVSCWNQCHINSHKTEILDPYHQTTYQITTTPMCHLL